MTDHEKMILISKLKGNLSESNGFYVQIICNHKILFISVYDYFYYTIITRQANRIMNDHELFFKADRRLGPRKTF